MAGIVSFGAYLPRLRLERMGIMQSMGWLAPGLITAAQGERSLCYWDEDALTIAVAASRDCLVGMDKSKIDAVFLASTSLPFADRSNAGMLAATLNLKEELSSADFTSTQKAGTTALVAALDTVRAGDKKQVLVTASDHRLTKSSWFYEMWFGDGAASLLLGKENVIAELLGSHAVTLDFVPHYRGSHEKYDYNWEERWIRDEGYMKIYPQAISGLLKKTGTNIKDVAKLCYPCFLGRAHGEIAKALGAAPQQVAGNMHAEAGECGTAHPLILLVRELEQAKPGDKIIVAGFGQGSDALLFQVTDRIKDLPKRSGVSGSLARRKPEKTYTKLLKFNELIETEMGIRAEVSNQTALSTLFRDRKLILGFVGGRCQKCGTPQIPSQRICVKPGCGAVDSQEDYEFADQPAKILTYTADMLAVSVDPPAFYGMVEFEKGGRMMMDFTDCDAKAVEVGVPVKITFRKKYFDRERGFTGYFWKAVPQA
ncbi:MAG: 3-hydroxy-3-methylglutaryl CoA synthase [Deltaproteobacteria bacterium RBG_13_61_14]|nr:MAG: 3-hydroxy-3-methylglutaryl CoA synthase [Deltaproteobacteria bacterium RBG_13_61_14]